MELRLRRVSVIWDRKECGVELRNRPAPSRVGPVGMWRGVTCIRCEKECGLELEDTADVQFGMWMGAPVLS